jgi:hypothetical protein
VDIQAEMDDEDDDDDAANHTMKYQLTSIKQITVHDINKILDGADVNARLNYVIYMHKIYILLI